MRKINFKSRMLLAFFALIFMMVACDDGFNEDEFLEKQAALVESKADKDHARALELIQAQLNATLAAMSAQAQYDEEMTLLQAMLTEELEKLKESLKSKEDSTSAANMLAAYRSAGLITEYKVVFQSDGEAVAGVKASISTIEGNMVSDALGVVTFVDVVVGPNELVVNSDDYVDFNLLLSFAAANVTQVGQVSVVEPKKAFSVLNLYSGNIDSKQTGTIKGKISIDSDLTNDGTELPPMEAVKVAVNFGASFAQDELIVSDNEVVTLGMKFTEGALGVATVDPVSGEYTIVVPANADGIEYELSVSEFTTTQKIASADDYVNVQTIFNAGSGADDIPFVQGVSVNTDIMPAQPGTGAQLSFTKVARFYQGPNTEFLDLAPHSANNATLQLTSRGAGYQASPVILKSGAIEAGWAYMDGFLKEYTVTDQGEDYTTIQVKVFVQGKDLGGNDFDVPFITLNVTPIDGKLPIEFNINGLLAGSSITKQKHVGNGKIESYTVIVDGDGTGAELEVVLDFKVSGIYLPGAPSFSVSTPEFTFQSEIEPTTKATLKLTDYMFQYAMEFDNTNASGYEVRPEFAWIYREDGNKTSLIRYNGGFGFTNVNFNDEIKLNGNGGLEFRETGTYSTVEYFKETPSAILEQNESSASTFGFELGENGELMNLFIDDAGKGYSKPFNVIVTPRFNMSPGTGAKVLSNVVKNNVTGEFTLQGLELTSSGSGYLDNLNQSTANVGFGNGEKVTVKTGQTVLLNIDYGTGLRTTTVLGDND
jgi:hypothetical protein